MKSLLTKLIITIGVGITGVCGLAWIGYVAYRGHAVEQEAMHYGERFADAVQTALAPHLDTMNLEAIQRVAEEYGANSAVMGLAVVGRKTGGMLAVAPPLPKREDPGDLAPCAGCHDGRTTLPWSSVADSRGGARSVKVFQALPRRQSCTVCHGPGTEPLGYLYLEVLASEIFEGFRREKALLAAGAAGTVALILALAYGAVFVLIFRPMRRLEEGAERIRNGESNVRIDLGSDDDLDVLAAAFETVAATNQPASGDSHTRLQRAREELEQVHARLSQFRETVCQGNGIAEAIHASVGRLERVIAQNRSQLEQIVGTTTDNSTSLIQLSASIDEVAGNAGQLAQQVSTTASAVVQMVQSVVEVTEKVEVLARETEITASSMAQIDGSTSQIEANAREATELGDRMAEAAREGSEAVQETLQGIHDSYDVIRDTARAMGELTQDSRAIGDVVKIINEINDKTKLLALNAAIIAAQAGEHGRSFAVVAHEIKSLSDRTAASTGQISHLIRGIRERMEIATDAVSKGEGATARSVELAERAGGTLERIRSTVQVSRDMTREILRATEEQSRGSQSVMASMQQVNAMVTYIRNAAQEHLVSGQDVSSSSEIMRNLTDQVRHATAEQAEVSRYLSEAITHLDRNIQELSNSMEQEALESKQILGELNELQTCQVGNATGLQEAEVSLQEVLRKLEDVEGGATRRAERSTGGDG